MIPNLNSSQFQIELICRIVQFSVLRCISRGRSVFSWLSILFYSEPSSTVERRQLGKRITCMYDIVVHF